MPPYSSIMLAATIAHERSAAALSRSPAAPATSAAYRRHVVEMRKTNAYNLVGDYFTYATQVPARVARAGAVKNVFFLATNCSTSSVDRISGVDVDVALESNRPATPRDKSSACDDTWRPALLNTPNNSKLSRLMRPRREYDARAATRRPRQLEGATVAG